MLPSPLFSEGDKGKEKSAKDPRERLLFHPSRRIKKLNCGPMSFCGFKRKVLPALALFLGLASPFAQVHRQVQHYGVENGLSLGSVTCLLQDKQGFLWVGTLNGLDRFDGYSFREFLHDPRDTTSLLDNQVTALSLGPDGKIWIGTAAGINVYDPVRDKLSKAGWWKKPGEKKSEVICLQFLGNGRLAIGRTI